MPQPRHYAGVLKRGVAWAVDALPFGLWHPTNMYLRGRRAAELDAENARLRERVSGLETELREAMDSLEAVRIANRDLIALVNR
ncbi:MAG TPA: hypothetical protein VK988_04275 [Acidimicrobiales bacterium]|nr:hypothetical protein [Acidimicrobiales bacterium]